jgi:TPR repeat protein
MEPEERSSTSAVQFVTSWQFETLEQDEPSEPEPANQPQTEESEPDAQVEQGEGAKLSEPAEQVLTAGPIETDDEPEPVAEVETVEQSFDQPEHAEHAEPTVQPSPEVQNDAFDIEETAITTQETYAVRDVWEDEEPEETAAESEIDDDELTGRVGPEEASQAESETLAPQAGVQEQALRDEISLGSATWDTKSGRSTERSEKKDEAAPSTARLAPRLPSREDRLLLTGKRALATPELRDTLKRLAPAFPTDGETPSDAVARLEKVVAKVDPDHVARIERRLAMLERNVAGIEERATQAAAEHSGADESSKVELGNVVDRLEGFERRQRGMMLKMMAEIRDTSRRLDAIETAKRLASAMADPEATVEPKSSEPDPAGSLENLETILLNDEVPSDTELETPSSASFLTHARRAAMSAVTSQLDTESIEADAKRRARRNRLIVGGIVAAALVLGGTAIVLRQAGSDAVPTAQMQQHANGQDFQRSTKLTRGASGPIDQLTARAGAGDTQAELIVGLKYLAGEGVSKNESSGAKWIARAALKGNTLAQYWLATLYERGRGVTADPVQAFAWYEKAAIGGNRKAMHNLAVAYAQGKGVGSNMAESARWFSQAASLGYVDSAFNLAVLYERGDGVPQSLLDAYKWYAIAANEGDTEAKTRMSAIESELSPDALDAAQKAASTFKPQQLQANASSNVRKASSSLAQ